MHLIDTHCHIHDKEFDFPDSVIDDARSNGVGQLIVIGTTAEDSEAAVVYATDHDGVWAAIGIHPHDALIGEDDLEVLARLAYDPHVVAIGECGLDYYYENTPRDVQRATLRSQLELAQLANKPCVFHVRDPKSHSFTTVGEAFTDFFKIIDDYPGARGVVHSFSAGTATLKEIESRGLLVGFNGIMTFTKDDEQLKVARTTNSGSIVLETDAPFLTPHPKRGKMNVPANVRDVATFLADLREEPLEQLIEVTTRNAQALFNLSNNTI